MHLDTQQRVLFGHFMLLGVLLHDKRRWKCIFTCNSNHVGWTLRKSWVPHVAGLTWDNGPSWYMTQESLKSLQKLLSRSSWCREQKRLLWKNVGTQMRSFFGPVHWLCKDGAQKRRQVASIMYREWCQVSVSRDRICKIIQYDLVLTEVVGRFFFHSSLEFTSQKEPLRTQI